MSAREIPPLPPDVAALVREARRAPGIPDATRRRLQGRVGATLLATGGGAALGLVGVKSTAGGIAGGAGGVGSAGSAGGATALAALRGALAGKVSVVASAFLIGGAAGVGGGYAVARHEIAAAARTGAPGNDARDGAILLASGGPVLGRPDGRDRPGTTPDVPDMPNMPFGPPTPARVPTPSALHVATHTSPPPSPIVDPGRGDDLASAAARDGDLAPAGARDGDLAAERALVDMARVSLARGASASALDALERHEAKFPAGRLVEDREALRVAALVGAGRHAEARERATHFDHRYPRSLLHPMVDAAVRSIPPASDVRGAPK